MLYTSEITGKSYKTIAELKEAEKTAKKIKTKNTSDSKKEEKERRIKEVEDAFNEGLATVDRWTAAHKEALEKAEEIEKQGMKAVEAVQEKFNSLLDAFEKDYGSYSFKFERTMKKRADDLVNEVMSEMKLSDKLPEDINEEDALNCLKSILGI